MIKTRLIQSILIGTPKPGVPISQIVNEIIDEQDTVPMPLDWPALDTVRGDIEDDGCPWKQSGFL